MECTRELNAHKNAALPFSNSHRNTLMVALQLLLLLVFESLALIAALAPDYTHCGLVHKDQMGNRLGSPHQHCPLLSDFHPDALPLTSSNPISRLPNSTIRLYFFAVPQPGGLCSCRILYLHVTKWKIRRGLTENKCMTIVLIKCGAFFLFNLNL